MNRILNKPFQTIWISIPLGLGIALIGFNSTLDLQWHDTYLVISTLHLGILLSILSGLIGFVYWIMRRKKLIDWMTLIHVVITVISFLLIISTGAFFQKLAIHDLKSFTLINQFIFGIFFLAIVSLILFLINMIISTAKNKRKPEV